MSNYYLQYGVTSENKLIICCYHSPLATKLTFSGLLQDKNTKIPSIANSGALPTDVDKVEEIVVPLLKEILIILKTNELKINSVYYSGDVNLGFPGSNQNFPSFLLDSTLHSLFKEHPMTQGVPVFIALESENLSILKKAADIHLTEYAGRHELNYSGSPVIMRVKRSTQDTYHSTEELKKFEAVPIKAVLEQGKNIKQIGTAFSFFKVVPIVSTPQNGMPGTNNTDESSTALIDTNEVSDISNEYLEEESFPCTLL